MTKPPLDILLCAPRGFCAGRRARHRCGGAGLGDPWRAGLCPARDRPQQIRGREPAAEGRGFCRRARRGAGWRCPGDFLGPRRAEIGAAEAAQRAAALRHRRHLSAGDQGPPRGQLPPQARAAHPADRPCRPPGGRRHHGPASRRRHDPAGDGRGYRGADPPRTNNLAFVTQTTLSVDDTSEMVARAEGSGIRRSSGRTRKTSATPPPTGRTRSRRRARWSMR